MGPACLGENQNGDLLRQLRLSLRQDLSKKVYRLSWARRSFQCAKATTIDTTIASANRISPLVGDGSASGISTRFIGPQKNFMRH